MVACHPWVASLAGVHRFFAGVETIESGSAPTRFGGLAMNRYVLCRLATATPISLVCAYASLPLVGGQDELGLSAEQWRKDLRYLAEQMPLKHKSLFHTMSAPEFHAAVAKLDSDIPALTKTRS